MRIPISQHATSLTSSMSFMEQSAATAQKQNHDVDGFSSLIGIVTAIIGNVLISIALNTQRYAHIRLNEQWLERRRLVKKAERRRLNRSYISETNLTKERQRLGRLSTTASGHANGISSEGYGNGNENDERQPLLGSFRSESQPSEEEVESDSEGKLPKPSQKSYLRSPYWWAGIIMMTVGEAGNFLAYGFAPASIVSPLGVVAIISNCIIAPFFMKEPFRWRDFWGVVIAVSGAVTVVLSARASNPKLGPHEIWSLIGTWEFETYLAITVILIIGLMLASAKYGQKSIFIDLGLVGLFGRLFLNLHSA
jgi:magnesium transporter